MAKPPTEYDRMLRKRKIEQMKNVENTKSTVIKPNMLNEMDKQNVQSLEKINFGYPDKLNTMIDYTENPNTTIPLTNRENDIAYGILLIDGLKNYENLMNVIDYGFLNWLEGNENLSNNQEDKLKSNPSQFSDIVMDRLLLNWLEEYENDPYKTKSSSPLNKNETNYDLQEQCVDLDKYDTIDVKQKINDWFNRNMLKNAEDRITKEISTNYCMTDYEQLNISISCMSLTESKTGNREFLNKYSAQNYAKAQNFVCPPLEWIHLVYLTIKHSPRDFVTAFDTENFVKRWFPYYSKMPIREKIYVTFNRYNLCFTDPKLIERSCYKMWTINNEFINILEEELIFYAEKYKNAIQRAIHNPDQLPALLKGYGVLYLGYDECMWG